MSFSFPKLPFPISFLRKNMKTKMILVFTDRFRPFSPLLTSGSARWLTSRAICHVVASGLCLSGEPKCTWHGPDTCRPRTPAWPWLRPGYSLSQNPGTLLRVARTLHREVRDPSRGFGLHHWRSRPCPEVWSGYDGVRAPSLIPWRIFSFMATWRPWCRLHGGVRCLFATRLKIAAWTSHLHIVVTGTLF
jgi:hypothetical protein